MSDPAERRIGSVIAGKWRLDALLGSGSMAAVYAATHRNGMRAALKILHPQLCTDPSLCERFLGEGYLTNSVKHAGIVRVLDDGITEDECVFLVMDLLEGTTLEELRQQRGGQLPLVETLDLADRLMDVLHAVHQAGIIHRDLKPQNVFICNDGSVKLLDFGVARVLDSAAQSKLSAFGLVLGTPSFMSPEQALGTREGVDHRSDIWSLGATLFTALTGQTVHLGPHVQARLLAAATVKARSITMAKRDIPLAIAAAIDTALRFKKEDRWQSVDALRRALRNARVELALESPRPRSEAQSLAPSASEPATQVEAPEPKPYGTLVGIAPDPATSELARVTTTERFPPVQLPAAAKAETDDVEQHEAYTPDDSDSYGTVPPNELLVDQLGRRRNGPGPWLVGMSLVAVAICGVGFFAVDRPTATAGAQTNAPELSSAAVVAPAPVPTPQPMASYVPAALPTPDTAVDAQPAASTAPMMSSAAARPTAVVHARPSRAQHPQTPSRIDVPPVVPPPVSRSGPEPSKPIVDAPSPALAPDPFSTPE